jgi:DNA-binding response OmpR family regulator
MTATKYALIVDDEPGIHEILKFYFEHLGVTSVHAYNGVEALSKISKQHIDVVICDLAMPGMSGTEVLEKVRSQGFKIPFIFISGAADKESAIKALRLGAFDFIEKPFEKKTIEDVVKQCLNINQSAPPPVSKVDTKNFPSSLNPLENLMSTITKMGKDLDDSQKAALNKLRADYLARLAEYVDLIKPQINKSELSALCRLMHNIKTTARTFADLKAENLAKALEACYTCLRALPKINIGDKLELFKNAHEVLRQCLDENLAKDVTNRKVDDLVSNLRKTEEDFINKLRTLI